MGDELGAGAVLEGQVVGSPVVNRRTMLQGSAALGVAGLATGPHPFYRTRAAAVPSAVAAAVPSGGVGALALPMLADGMNMDRPEYYDTLQAGSRPQHRNRLSADVNGDGQDELIVRGPGGILAYVFDADSGQWFTLPGQGPAWSDAAGWSAPRYYETIQTADIDGDGRAELLGLGPDGLEAWRYDAAGQEWQRLAAPQPLNAISDDPSHYLTLQCADIDGDGRDELVGRSSGGLHGWKWTGSGWAVLPTVAALSDQAGFVLPQYYTTIQLADVDGDGRAELLARFPDGMHGWKLVGTGWAQIATNTRVSDTEGWMAPGSFLTLQCADIDGDGHAELIGLGAGGVQAWRYTALAAWTPLATLSAVSQAGGWLNPQYALTIQCADIDGDGRAELIARGSGGIRAWRFSGSNAGQWSELARGPAWSDGTGWAHAQNSLTIQTARVNPSAVNTNNPSAGGTGPAAVVLGRSSTAVEVWRFGGAAWTRTSAPWPSLDPVAYAAVSAFLGVTNKAGVRALYNDLAADLDGWRRLLGSTPRPAPPTGYPGTDSSWYDTVAQIADELTWVAAVQTWFTLERTLLDTMFLGDSMSVDVVIAAMNAKVTDDSDAALSTFSVLFNAAWAILGVPDGAEVMAAVAGLAAVAVQAVQAAGGAPPTLADSILQISLQLEDLFGAAVAAVDDRLLVVTGGLDADGRAVVGDYGLMQAIGRQIVGGVAAWTWEAGEADRATVAGQRSYAVSVWQMLETPADWRWSVVPALDESDAYVPLDAIWVTGSPCHQYLMVQYATALGILPDPDPLEAAVLTALHGKASPTTIFPLGVPPLDVIRAQHGWPQVRGTKGGAECIVTDVYSLPASAGTTGTAGVTATAATSSAAVTGVTAGKTRTTKTTLADRITGRASTPRSRLAPTGSWLPAAGGPGTGEARKEAGTNPLRAPGVDLDVVTRLVRTTTGSVVAEVEVLNRGLSPAADVEVVAARLRGRRASSALPTRRRHLDDGEAGTFRVHFVGVPGKAGQRVQFQLAGSYDGGTFEQNVQVTLP